MNFLPRCIAFYHRIPIDKLNNPNSNAMQLGKAFFTAMFSVIFCRLTCIMSKPLFATWVSDPGGGVTSVSKIRGCPFKL